MNKETLKKRMTIEEAAKIFFQDSVSKGLLYKLCNSKEIPHVRLSSGKILLDSEELEKWWENKLRESTQDESVKEIKKYGSLRRIIV